MTTPRLAVALSSFLAFSSSFAGENAAADQSALPIVTNAAARTLEFEWPAIRIGTGEYSDGPTGVTVFYFPQPVLAAVDVRGGAPGTVNTDYLRLQYDVPSVDAVVFSGGSSYGLESATAVATAMMDDGVRGGHWTNIALSVGAIIYDFGDRRLNEIYPDKRLAQAAFRAAKPNVFPLGAHGAGRFARSGGLFRCNAHSGQGGAFRQIGEVKIAAFTIVNSLGVIVRRDGRVAACYPDATWPTPLHASDLLAGAPESRKPGWSGGRNTTISLVVTNQKMAVADLQRLAVQVHQSMGRAIQPFATESDGDVLYAASTAELDPANGGKGLANVDLGIIASEVMWDAVLSSVPPQPATLPAARVTLTPAQLRSYAGDYSFSPNVSLNISVEGQRLLARATGARNVHAIAREKAVELQPTAAGEFTVPGRYPLVLRFERDQLIVNPGHWEQRGRR